MSTDVHTLSGAYALHALSDSEVAEFERHLAGCATCRAEVDEFRSVTASLAELEPQVVPQRLKDAVLRAADAQRQLPPLVTRDELGKPADPGTPSTPATSTDPGRTDETLAPVVPISRRARVTRALVATAAAIALVVGVGYGIDSANLEDRPLAASAAQVFGSPDARTLDLEMDDGGHVVVARSPSTNQVAIDTRDMPDPGADRVYQLWTVTNGSALSAGVLVDGGTALRMPERGTTLAITVEPQGGSKSPTMPLVVQVDPTTV